MSRRYRFPRLRELVVAVSAIVAAASDSHNSAEAARRGIVVDELDLPTASKSKLDGGKKGDILSQLIAAREENVAFLSGVDQLMELNGHMKLEGKTGPDGEALYSADVSKRWGPSGKFWWKVQNDFSPKRDGLTAGEIDMLQRVENLQKMEKVGVGSTLALGGLAALGGAAAHAVNRLRGTDRDRAARAGEGNNLPLMEERNRPPRSPPPPYHPGRSAGYLPVSRSGKISQRGKKRTVFPSPDPREPFPAGEVPPEGEAHPAEGEVPAEGVAPQRGGFPSKALALGGFVGLLTVALAIGPTVYWWRSKRALRKAVKHRLRREEFLEYRRKESEKAVGQADWS